MQELNALIMFAIDDFSPTRGITALPHQEVESFRLKYQLSPSSFCDLFMRRIAHEYEEEKYTKPQIHSIVIRDRILGANP